MNSMLQESEELELSQNEKILFLEKRVLDLENCLKDQKLEKDFKTAECIAPLEVI